MQTELDSTEKDEQSGLPEAKERTNRLMHVGPQSIPDRIDVEDAIVRFRTISDSNTDRDASTDLAVDRLRGPEDIKTIEGLRDSVAKRLSELGTLLESEEVREYSDESPKDELLLPLYEEVDQLDGNVERYIALCEQIEQEIQAAEVRIAEINTEITNLNQEKGKLDKYPDGLSLKDRWKWQFNSSFVTSVYNQKNSIETKIEGLNREAIGLKPYNIVKKYETEISELKSKINVSQRKVISDQEELAKNIGAQLAEKDTLAEVIEVKTGYASIIKRLQVIAEKLASVKEQRSEISFIGESIHPIVSKYQSIQLPEKPIDLYMSDIREEYFRTTSTRMSGLPMRQIKEGTSGASEMVPKKYRGQREELTPAKVVETAVSSDMLFAMTRDELEELAQMLESAPKLTAEQEKLKALFGPINDASPIESRISRALRGRERLASFTTESEAAFCAHATSPRNAALILESGTLHSEVEVKQTRARSGKDAIEVANSPQGKVVEESTIALSLDGVEEQYLRGSEEDRRTDAPKGLVFTFPFLGVGSQKSWFLNENTQFHPERYPADEIQVIDDGSGLEVENSLIFCRSEDFGYWKKVAEETGHSKEWVSKHLIPYTSTSEIALKSREYALNQNKGKPKMAPVYNGVHADVRVRIDHTDMAEALMGRGMNLSPTTETIRAIPTFLLEETT